MERPQYYRLKRMVELLKEGTRTGRYVNASTFAGEFGITRRTVLRDMDLLKDEQNAPIEYDSSRKGYFLADTLWQLAPAELSRREIFAFSMARKLMEGFRGTPLEMDLQSVLRKIGESLEGKITVEPGILTEHLSVFGEDYVKQDTAMWAAVADAVDRRAEVRVVYEKFNGDVKGHVLEPYHMVAYHGNWYVLAGVPAEEGVRTYAVSRFRKFEATGRLFDMPSRFDAKEHMRMAFGIMRGEEVLDVRLIFSRDVATYIRERVWHPSQTMLERKNGSLELRLKTAGWKELVRWILSWQPDVKVLAPARLRERVRLKMRQGLRGM